MGEPFDAIVIGAGAAGMTVAVGLAGFGKRVAIVEATRVGGDCTNTGCIPSKRLIHLARQMGEPVRSSTAVLSDVRATRDGLATREHDELSQLPNLTLIQGRARLASRSMVDVDGRTLTAKHVIVATGSRPIMLDVPGLPESRVLTNEQIFEVQAPPAHLVIVGAGAIGVEMAHAFFRLGSRVTLVDLADRVLPSAATGASAAVTARLEDVGITTYLESRAVTFDESTRTLTLQTPSGPASVDDVDSVLIAVGRRPNVEGLGLAEVGVDVTRGVVVDTWGRTSVRGIWAAGDVTVGSNQTHAANALGRRIVQRIALPWLPPFTRPPLIPTAVFCEPEVAWVGPRPDDPAYRTHPGSLRTVRIDMADLDRGLTDGVDEGFLEITARRFTGRIIAATIVGPHAPEIVETVAHAMERKSSMLRLSRRAYAYPTFASILGKAGDTFAREASVDIKAEIGAYLRFRLRRPKGIRT